MNFSLEKMYKDQVKFSYCSFDRIVIRGHVPVLQGSDGGGIVFWARSLDPDIILEKSWFESFPSKFHQNVKKFAQENNIPIVENKPLAQALFKGVEIGQEIPAVFYKAVAEVLSYVFRLKNKRI